MPAFQKWKPLISFVAGLVGIAYEAVIHSGEPRSEFLIIYVGMLGLTAFLKQDQDRSNA